MTAQPRYRSFAETDLSAVDIRALAARAAQPLKQEVSNGVEGLTRIGGVPSTETAASLSGARTAQLDAIVMPALVAGTHVLLCRLASPFGRKLGLATLGFSVSAMAGAAVWHFGWSRYDLADLAHQASSGVAVSIVIFIAAALSSTVGFAFSAIAAAMIFHFVSDTVEAVQIMIVASIAIQAYSVAGMWRTISLRACTPFLIGGAATIPAGIYLLLSFRPHAYIFTAGLALALYGAYMLLTQPPSIKRGGSLTDVAVGALGGITGPLAAFPGAFVTIWCGMRGWDKVTQRSVYQPYILIMQVLTLGGLSIVSGRSILNADLIAYALPGVAGAYLGLQVFQKLSDVQFRRFVHLALIASGIALAFK